MQRIALTALLGMIVAMPAAANWFDAVEYGRNHKKIIGSTSSPTPDDLRAIGDSKYGSGKTYTYNEKDGHWHEVKNAPSDAKKEPAKPQDAVKPAEGQ